MYCKKFLAKSEPVLDGNSSYQYGAQPPGQNKTRNPQLFRGTPTPLQEGFPYLL